MDVAPTILYLLGEPVPEDMDGVVLTDAIETTFRAARPLQTGAADTQRRGTEEATYSAADEAVITKRLEDLGYLE